MSDLMVANTILSQLGGRRFMVMTGAKHMVAVEDGLSFRLPGGGGFCRHGINAVRVTLNSMDLYDVDFIRIRGTTLKTVERREGLYGDSLQPVFTEVTGLNTRL